MHVARFSIQPVQASLSPRRGIKREVVFGALLMALDTMAFTCAYLGLLHLRTEVGGQSDSGRASNLCPLVICLVSIHLVFSASHRYSLRVDMNSLRFAAEHGIACLIAFVMSLLLQFAVFIFDFSRSRMALMMAFLFFAPVALGFRRLLGRSFRFEAKARTFVILGAGSEAVDFYHACQENKTPQILRFVDPSGIRTGTKLDGPDSPTVEACTKNGMASLLDDSVDAIVMAEQFSSLPQQSVETLVRAHFYHAPILSVETFHEKYWSKIPVATMDPLWALRQDFRLARDSSYRMCKRGVDIIAAILGLLLLLPLFLFCSLAIRLERNGPIFYCQQRIRRDRQQFTLYKFRTMTPAGGESSGEDLYLKDDDWRVTKVGRWLRKLRLDELPQLWNVVKGDMSLIGPRAEWDCCVDIYEQVIPGYHFRHLVKPGITGWAQVNCPCGRSIKDTVEKLKYDLYYIKNYSLLLDASILLKTCYVIMSFKGK